MAQPHLTSNDIEQFTENENRAALDSHLQNCALCRARVESASRLNATLRAVPRAPSARDLVARVSAGIEARLAQEQARRARASFIAVATGLSALLVLWFALETFAALQDNSTLEYLEWISTHPELFASNFGDTIFALIEIVPVSETLLTLFALFTVGVLVQQWIATMRAQTIMAQAGFE
jgi:predicted anti-sigma-YlaC factor YlaD